MVQFDVHVVVDERAVAAVAAAGATLVSRSNLKRQDRWHPLLGCFRTTTIGVAVMVVSGHCFVGWLFWLTVGCWRFVVSYLSFALGYLLFLLCLLVKIGSVQGIHDVEGFVTQHSVARGCSSRVLF